MITGDHPDWSTLKPSTAPRLTEQEIVALPAGMVVSIRERAAMVIGPGIVRYWDRGNWGRSTWVDIHDRVFLPRLPRMSFALTTDAIRNRQKDVTRRLELPKWWQTWRWFLGVDKVRQVGAQGLCIAQCVSARYERLYEITREDVIREGFPDTTPEGFAAMFSEVAPESWTRNGAPWLWRLEFRYLEVPT